MSVVEYDPKGMPFRRLGPSGLRVPDRPVITTKLYWGEKNHPNGTGLSRKHCKHRRGHEAVLERLGLDYVDVIFAHRPTPPVIPMDEVVRAFNFVIDQGWAFYWATSEWSAREIEEAYHVADKLGLQGPIAEQCQHHMFHRDRPEGEYGPLYKKYGLGTTVFSALSSGLLTGKVSKPSPRHGTCRTTTDPAGSRFENHKDFFKNTIQSLNERRHEEAREACLAWIAINPNTSTQVVENLKALEVIPKLTPEVLAKIEEILQNKPALRCPTFGRPALDKFGRL
ncbi:NADP-dependent oxidoreductase domain-containing protein [Fomitopsis serialis]|uniref:NADP-dependent oxidoreductase domain-containing protein n=1 Tax=Fomitopsis serialis TaxID=139415 RepID=UPI0020087E25|nr:NADP-dependent oxidoreductase domain-containing protein [Neoantrodia serialis]KAH9923604.1 NADP-dependent oxidoreductase domain-containing protein [Neoantrodia serialis]